MKKFFTVFLISLIFSSAAFAKMGFQADFKGYAGGDIEIFTNYDKSVSNSSVLFTGSQLDLTLRFGSYVGITAGLGSSFSMYCFGNLCGDKYSASLLSNPHEFYMVSGIFGLTGYIPLNQNWKLKITQGITIFDLYRYPEEFKNAPYFYFAGYGGSVSAMWLPVKHFGVSMGVDYNAGYARENVKFNYNDFLGYVSHNYYLCLKPFIGGTVVLGKNN